MHEIIVDLEELGKSYPMGKGQVHALRQVNLKVKRGESLSIMGPSGSGKSTLMHLLGCLDRPSTGHYRFNGQDIAGLTDRELSSIRSQEIGFVFQAYNLIPQLNVLENVEIPFLYQTEKLSREKAIHAVERVGLKHRLYHLPKELSGGEMQRVAIARALVINPSMILADEPTGNLDFATGCSILELFQELNLQGVTLMLVTHDEFVGKHCKRLIRMQDGRIISEERRTCR